MKDTLDLRVQKTYLALTTAFMQLLAEKKFEHITVNEICDRAMIRRATFYKHFGDKYELFTFTIREIQNSFKQKTEASIAPNTPDSYTAIVKNLLDFMEANEKLVHSVMESDVFSILLDILSEQIILDVKPHFLKDRQNGKELPFSPELMAQAFTGGLLQVAKWWVQNKNAVKKEDMVRQTAALLKKMY